ncbi:MAG: peptide chain release factor N(5)-glutamine methyltransferase [Deltaproteobacteria bacterium]|nr:peptide chain release factor N(5)-glutamine methyltransferase [Deltaproteobacteria bacterium]
MTHRLEKGTVLSALMWGSSELKGAGIESFRLDSEILLSEVLGLSRIQLYINYDRPMNQREKERYFLMIKRRKRREPIAYILNKKEFMSLQFYVDRRVLIPRPDTECMVEWLLKSVEISKNDKILDLGTGSGCIAVSILRNTSLKRIFVSDISEEALLVADRNLKVLCPDKEYILIHSSLFEKFSDSDFDLIISNPPYIKREDLRLLAPEITEFEPIVALDGGDSGDEIVNRLILESYSYLRRGGLIIFEHSEDFVLLENLIKDRFSVVHLGRDYSNRYRFTVLRRL